MSCLTFPVDVAACAAGILHTISEVNQRLLPQMAVPCFKLACSAWHVGPTGGAVGRACLFCGGPAIDSFTHYSQCNELFAMIQDVLPRLAWAPSPPGRVLELFGVGADAPRRVLIGTVIDSLWAALVAHKRPARAGRGAFKARLDVMARLSPHLAAGQCGPGARPYTVIVVFWWYLVAPTVELQRWQENLIFPGTGRVF
jgi:hypothetical protein